MGNDTDASVKVSKATRERLGILAAEQGTTIRSLVEELARAEPTQAELAARGEAARSYLREHMGVGLAGADEAAGQGLLDALAVRAGQAHEATA